VIGVAYLILRIIVHRVAVLVDATGSPLPLRSSSTFALGIIAFIMMKLTPA